MPTGAEYYGKKVGSLGDAGCFSFYANKIITTGEGGMVIFNDKKLANKAKNLKELSFGKYEKLNQMSGKKNLESMKSFNIMT